MKYKKDDIYQFLHDYLCKLNEIISKSKENEYEMFENLLDEVFYETNSKYKSYMISIYQTLKYKIFKSKRKFLIILICIILLLPYHHNNENMVDRIKNKEIIKEYENYIDSYIENFDKTNLDDYEIIMKVVCDMWDIVSVGFQEPEYDLHGLMRVDVINGKVVCRNISDDIAYRLNLINPKYNARILAINAEFGSWKINNCGIKRNGKKVNVELANIDYDNIRTTDESIIDHLRKINNYNHEVVLADIPDSDITLIIDATNGGIGTYINGKLEMFNSDNEEFVYAYNYAQLYQIGYDNYFKSLKSYMKSYNLKEDYSDLEKKYGLEKQNEIIDKIRKK